QGLDPDKCTDDYLPIEYVLDLTDKEKKAESYHRMNFATDMWAMGITLAHFYLKEVPSICLLSEPVKKLAAVLEGLKKVQKKKTLLNIPAKNSPLPISVSIIENSLEEAYITLRNIKPESFGSIFETSTRFIVENFSKELKRTLKQIRHLIPQLNNLA